MALLGPMLAPNESINFSSSYLKFPLLASVKFDGNRLLVINGKLYSRSMKIQPNTFLNHHLRHLTELSRDKALVFDCELYSEEMTFPQLQSIVRAHSRIIPNHVKARVFDCMSIFEWETVQISPSFKERVDKYTELLSKLPPEAAVKAVYQRKLDCPEDAKEMYQEALRTGFEGLMLRDPRSRYKHGRATLLEGTIFKFKEFVTIDAKITGFTQAKRMKKEYQDSDREEDELGHTKRTHKIENYEYIEAIGSTEVQLPDGTFVGVGCARGFELPYGWHSRDKMLGKMVEIRYMEHGAKDKPRMGAITRFRPDLDTST